MYYLKGGVNQKRMDSSAGSDVMFTGHGAPPGSGPPPGYETPLFLKANVPKASMYHGPEEGDVKTFTFDFLASTSAHGLPKIATASGTFRKMMWMVIFLVAFGFFCYLITTLFTTFFKYEVVVNTKMVHSTSTLFPAVTLCNMNALKRNQLSGDDMYAALYEVEVQYENGPESTTVTTTAATNDVDTQVFQVQVTLQMPYNQRLNNSGSEQYQNLSAAVCSQIYESLQNDGDLNNAPATCAVLTFSPGSVISTARVTLNTSFLSNVRTLLNRAVGRITHVPFNGKQIPTTALLPQRETDDEENETGDEEEGNPTEDNSIGQRPTRRISFEMVTQESETTTTAERANTELTMTDSEEDAGVDATTQSQQENSEGTEIQSEVSKRQQEFTTQSGSENPEQQTLTRAASRSTKIPTLREALPQTNAQQNTTEDLSQNNGEQTTTEDPWENNAEETATETGAHSENNVQKITTQASSRSTKMQTLREAVPQNYAQQTTTEVPSQNNEEQTTVEVPSLDNAQESTTEAPSQNNVEQTPTEAPSQNNVEQTTTEDPSQNNAEQTTTKALSQNNVEQTTIEDPGENNVEHTTTEAPSQKNVEQTTTEAPSQNNAEQTATEDPSQNNVEQTTTEAPSQNNLQQTIGETEAPSQNNVEQTTENPGENNAEQTTTEDPGEKNAEQTTTDGSFVNNVQQSTTEVNHQTSLPPPSQRRIRTKRSVLLSRDQTLPRGPDPGHQAATKDPHPRIKVVWKPGAPKPSLPQQGQQQLMDGTIPHQMINRTGVEVVIREDTKEVMTHGRRKRQVNGPLDPSGRSGPLSPETGSAICSCNPEEDETCSCTPVHGQPCIEECDRKAEMCFVWQCEGPVCGCEEVKWYQVWDDDEHQWSDWQDDPEFEPEDVWTVEGDNDFAGFLAQASTSDLSDLVDVFKPTESELDEYGTRAEEFIVQCSFDKKNCSYRDFRRTFNSYYGNCYTFNHGHDVTSRRVTSKYGSRYGLRLTMFLDVDEYLGMFSPTVGVRVAVHPADETPFPQDKGVSAPPQQMTNIGVKLVEIVRKAHPYPSNCTDGKGYQLNQEGNYTNTACSLTCLENQVKKRCNCSDGLISRSENETRCSISNRDHVLCKSRVYFMYDQGRLGCDCPLSCRERDWQMAVSSSQWPSEHYLNLLTADILLDKLEGGGDHIRNIIRDHTRMRENLVRVHVYLESQTITSIEESPAYGVERLLADIGGSLGLFIGVSVCSAIEILEFLADLCLMACARCRKKRQRSITHVKPLI